MKKIISALVILALFVASFNFTIVHKRVNNLSSLVVQNIEALSYAESTNQFCLGVGSVDCPVSEKKVKIVY